MKKSISFIMATAMLISVIITISCRNEEIITFRSLLREMTEAEAITRFPDPSYRHVQFSSFDRRSVHPDSAGWFANNDFTQFIRKEARVVSLKREMLSADTLALAECAQALHTNSGSEGKNDLKSLSVGKFAPGAECLVRISKPGLAVSSFTLALEAADTGLKIQSIIQLYPITISRRQSNLHTDSGIPPCLHEESYDEQELCGQEEEEDQPALFRD
jgi:hypothetical protein